MPGLTRLLSERARAAISTALDTDAEPDVRECADARFGDYQINGVLPLAKVLRDNPRKLAQRVVEALDIADLCQAPEIAGPGFINLRLKKEWIAAEVGRRATDDRLGVDRAENPKTIVVDFSSPNVAKKMHVGHLRSTIIGDAIVRTLRFVGHNVIGDNHVGDWGTQFGILIWAFKNHANEQALTDRPVPELERLYKLGTAKGKEDPAIAEACRAELAKLQAGDEENLALWNRFVAISRADAESIYARLGVQFDTWRGESAYNDDLPGVVDKLAAKGLARESQGATVIFYGEDSPKELQDKPFLIRKSDGAFLYSTTDLATVDYRVAHEKADTMIYVVDSRQSLHFKQLFEAARLAGYPDVNFIHVGFGMLLGADGKPFRTRDGKTVALVDLLDEARERILPKVREKWADASAEEQAAIAGAVGIAAVKFADLGQNLATDYKFTWDKLLAADGYTGPYVQYTAVRIKSIFRKLGDDGYSPDGASLMLDSDEATTLCRVLLKLQDVLDRAERTLLPHVLCEYVYELARAFNAFYMHDKVLDAPSEALKASRLALCHAAGTAFDIVFGCLNLPMMEKM